MMFVSTHFGPITVDEAGVVEFPEGLPGFEERRRFFPLQASSAAGLVFLQSLECAELCFLGLPVQSLRSDYQIVLTSEDRQALGLSPAEVPVIGTNVAALAIVSVADGREPSVNLRSPVVIHMRTRVAVQAIRPDEKYGCREPLSAREAACS